MNDLADPETLALLNSHLGEYKVCAKQQRKELLTTITNEIALIKGVTGSRKKKGLYKV